MINYSEKDLSGRDFSDDDCRGADFRNADLTGSDLTRANLAGADFTGADCRRAVFRDADLTGADFRRADCQDVDFTGSDCQGADFRDADCRSADFRDADCRSAIFSGADLTSAVGLPEAPIVPDIDAQILREIEKDPGRFDMGHWCGTTLCRGGFAILLAGAAGQKLADRLGCDAAASLIYNASRPGQRIPSWYISNEEALEDLRVAALRGPF